MLRKPVPPVQQMRYEYIEKMLQNGIRGRDIFLSDSERRLFYYWKKETYGKSKLKVLPEREEVLQEQEEVLPEQEEVLPEREEVLPEREEVLPEREEVLQEREEVLPEQEGLLPEQEDVLSKQEKALPGHLLERYISRMNDQEKEELSFLLFKAAVEQTLNAKRFNATVWKALMKALDPDRFSDYTSRNKTFSPDDYRKVLESFEESVNE